jgi:hypothetical protein
MTEFSSNKFIRIFFFENRFQPNICLRQTFRRIQRLSPDDRHGDIDQAQRVLARDSIQQVNVIADFLQYWATTSHNLAMQLG